MTMFNRFFKNRYEESIIKYLKTRKDGAFFGDILMNVRGNHTMILETLIKLKKEGKIHKEASVYKIKD
jgi:hypothetical protein